MYTEAELVRIAKRENNTRRKYFSGEPVTGKAYTGQSKRGITDVSLISRTYKRGISIREASDGRICRNRNSDRSSSGDRVSGSLYADYAGSHRWRGLSLFSESHSHATEQKLVKTDLDKIIGKTDRIIFIEDEVTTGNTILNIVRLIQKTYAKPVSFAVASILNGMNEEALENYQNLKIPVHYLVKTTHDTYTEIAEQYQADGICHICTKPQEEEIQRQKEMRQQKKATQQIEMQEISGWINTRRLHAADTYQQACEQLWKEIQQKYHYIKETETGRRILVLGTEEFMYPALYVGAKLEEAGYTVRMHATTRSPIAVSKEEKYPLHTRYELASINKKNRITFVYDLTEYEEVLVLTDAQNQETEGWESLQRALALNQNRQIRGIRWC